MVQDGMCEVKDVKDVKEMDKRVSVPQNTISSSCIVPHTNFCVRVQQYFPSLPRICHSYAFHFFYGILLVTTFPFPTDLQIIPVVHHL